MPGDINTDNIETGTITRNEISTTSGKRKADTTIITTKIATRNPSLKIREKAVMATTVTTKLIQNSTHKKN